jgi:hypothetical protein
MVSIERREVRPQRGTTRRRWLPTRVWFTPASRRQAPLGHGAGVGQARAGALAADDRSAGRREARAVVVGEPVLRGVRSRRGRCVARGTAPVPRVKPCLWAALAGTPIDQREQIPLELEPQLRLDVLDCRGAETEGGSAHVGISKGTCRTWRPGPNPAARRPLFWARDLAPRLLDTPHAAKIPGNTLLASLPFSLRFLPACI